VYVNGQIDASKALGTGSRTSQCSETHTSGSLSGQYKYNQARITAFPTYTEITVADPWLELFNAVGGIIALVDTVFVGVLMLVKLVGSSGGTSTESVSVAPQDADDLHSVAPQAEKEEGGHETTEVTAFDAAPPKSRDEAGVLAS